MNEKYDVSFSLEGKEYEGKVTIPDANKNLTEDEKINSVKRHSKGLAKKYSQKDVENLTVKKRKKAMNRIISIMIILVLGNINIMFAQNTSLVVDNQNPGWLSSKIPFKNQESVKNLTVTGYINGTDIKFIRELINNRALTHLDLTNTNIVAGGENYYNTYKVEKDNTLYNEMFSGKANGIDYLALPLSITKIEASPDESRQINSFYDKVDTLIIGGSINMLSKYYLRNNIKYLYIREGVDSIEPYNYRKEQFKKIHLPKTLKSLGEGTFYCDTIDINLDNLHFIDHRAIIGTLVGDTIRFSKGISTIYTCSFGLNKGTTLFMPKNVTIIDRSCVSGHHYDHNESFFLGLKIHLESPTPPQISNSGYWNDFLSSSTVYVPKGSIDTYKKAKYWSYATILEETVPVTGITLDQENISFSDIGASVQLTATILPTDADNQKVIWKSSDTKVATVKDGKVTCTGYGTAIITATSEEGGYIATCNVTATKRIVLPSSITLNRNEATIKVGETTTLKANVLPVDADDKTIVWSSENSDIASVTNDGVVTGHKAGTTKIIVTTNANGLKDECILTVHQPVTGITLDRQNISFANIGETVQLTANVLPEDASNKNVSWASSDTKVAIVSNGNVVCTGYGTAVISAITEDGGYMATCVINATSGINGINEDKGYQDAKRYDATGREINNPINGLNIIKTQDGRVIKTNKQ